MTHTHTQSLTHTDTDTDTGAETAKERRLSRSSPVYMIYGSKHNRRHTREVHYNFSVGDSVFVKLNSDKHTGGATVIPAVLKGDSTCQEGAKQDRVRVRYSHDNSTFNVRRSKLVPRFHRPCLILTRNTVE